MTDRTPSEQDIIILWKYQRPNSYRTTVVQWILVLKGSQAVKTLRPSEEQGTRQGTTKLRDRLKEKGILADSDTQNDALLFTKDHEFSSPSAAGAVVCGGATNGLIFWKTAEGEPLQKKL